MSSVIRDALAATAASPDPVASLIGATAIEYLDTRDRSLVAKIPQGGPAEAGAASKLAVSTALGHPDSEALLELVALLIADHRYREPLVYPEGYYGGIGNGMSQVSPEPTFQKGFTALLAAARRVSVPDEEIARYLLMQHYQTLDARWISPENLPFGSAMDPRLLSHLVADNWSPATPSEEFIWNLPDEVLARLATAEGPYKSRYGRKQLEVVHVGFLALLAKFRSEILGDWVGRQLSKATYEHAWGFVLQGTDRYDREAVELSRKLPPSDRFLILVKLSVLRGEPYITLAREAAAETDKSAHAMVMAFLADHFPEDLAGRMEGALARKELDHEIPQFIYENVFIALARIWDKAGGRVFEAILAGDYHKVARGYSSEAGRVTLYSYLVRAILLVEPQVPEARVRDWTARAIAAILASGADKKEINPMLERVWHEVVSSRPQPLLEPLFVILGDKLKTLRQLAVQGLAKLADDEIVTRVAGLLASGKADQKLGAAALLGTIGSAASSEALQSALQGETNDKVRAAIHEALQGAGKSAPSSKEAGGEAAVSLAELEAGFAKQVAKLKLPSTSWLKAEAFPAVFAKDGSELSKAAVAFLVSKQAKHKNIEAAPDSLPLLAHVDREKSAAFGLALVEGFLNSEQAAADRWALTLGGLLGDKRVIPPLLSRIPDWCENARHKLAEYSAQAIALLPGNEPLMVLDTLANRYRSKFKNVGKACAEAFSAAAAARGITPDELGDMVAPDFGFDAEGLRRFEWEGGKAQAELDADFKLAWSDPDSEKSWKALPASAPEAVKAEVKTLTKLLKEAVKGQTARLEMTLVRQRRWAVARWRELYENHPLLRSFASSLVWGIYDGSGTLLRTFRRYPNGLLANAAGDLEELPEEDTRIGMVHPLELEAAALDAWRAHLARFKVKQPFPQIGRPVELMDPLHGNRREITLANGKKVGAGTFRSRTEKRGWYRGSVVDAGGISSVYKPFPGAGYEAILPTENYWIGIDPMDSVELGSAYFVKAESVGRGSYTYDEPGKDDPRVLRFDEVPAVVFSEAVSDLKAITGA